MPQRYASGSIIKRGDPYTLKASSAETASTTGATVETREGGCVHVEVNVTAASGTTPTMTVVIEGSNDGTNWYTLATFGSNGYAAGAVATAPANFTAAAGPIRGCVPAMQFIRSRSVIGGTTPSFTYAVSAEVN